MRVREAVADLGARLDRRRVVEFARAHRLAERLPRDELVRDVDVAGVPRERVCAQAARMAQPCRGGGLALGAGGGLALAGDDLQRDVEARLLVAREPDRPVAAAPERAERAVAPEDERGALEGGRGIRHGSRPSGRTARFPACPRAPDRRRGYSLRVLSDGA